MTTQAGEILQYARDAMVSSGGAGSPAINWRGRRFKSKKALASALDIDVHDLDHEETRMKRCPECDSNHLYEYEDYIDTTTIGGGLIPKLGSGIFASAKVRPVVCAQCGFLKLYAAREAIEEAQRL